MSRQRAITVSGAALAALALAASPVLPAQAASVKEWTIWSEPSSNSGDGGGTFSFTDSRLVGGSYDFLNTTNAESLNSDDGSWFEADTPIGAVFGANGPEAVAYRFRVDADAATNSTFTVTFDTAVPAGQLGFAVSDIDDDQSTVTGTDADGNALTGAQLNGTATDQAFNFCVVASPPADCGGDTDTPVLTTNASDVVAVGTTSPSSSDGATAWFMPSVAVKSLTFELEVYGDPGEEGHHDYWIAQKIDDDPALPNTGFSSASVNWLLGSGIALVAAGGLMLARRRA